MVVTAKEYAGIIGGVFPLSASYRSCREKPAGGVEFRLSISLSTLYRNQREYTERLNTSITTFVTKTKLRGLGNEGHLLAITSGLQGDGLQLWVRTSSADQIMKL